MAGSSVHIWSLSDPLEWRTGLELLKTDSILFVILSCCSWVSDTCQAPWAIAKLWHTSQRSFSCHHKLISISRRPETMGWDVCALNVISLVSGILQKNFCIHNWFSQSANTDCMFLFSGTKIALKQSRTSSRDRSVAIKNLGQSSWNELPSVYK